MCPAGHMFARRYPGKDTPFRPPKRAFLTDSKLAIAQDRTLFFSASAAELLGTETSNGVQSLCQDSQLTRMPKHRVGKLLVDRCEELKVPPGRDFTQLKLGHSVVNREGKTVHPAQVR